MPKGIYKHLGHKMSEEARRKISLARKGMKFSGEHKKNMSLAMKGKTPWIKGKHHSKETKGKMSLSKIEKPTNYWLGKRRLHMAGKNNWNWKGNNVGYMGLHIWVGKWLGKAQHCSYCKSTTNITWANKSHEYKRDLNDWIQLCVKCHKKYDSGQKGAESYFEKTKNGFGNRYSSI